MVSSVKELTEHHQYGISWRFARTVEDGSPMTGPLLSNQMRQPPLSGLPSSSDVSKWYQHTPFPRLRADNESSPRFKLRLDNDTRENTYNTTYYAKIDDLAWLQQFQYHFEKPTACEAGIGGGRGVGEIF